MSPPRSKLLERRSSEAANGYRLVPSFEPPKIDARSLILQPRMNSHELSTRPAGGRPAHPPNRKEAVLESMLHLSDEDMHWIMLCVLRRRPSLESALEAVRRHGHHPEKKSLSDSSALAHFLAPRENDSYPVTIDDLRCPVNQTSRCDVDFVSQPVLQFMSAMAYVSEDTSSVRLQVLRTGRTNCRSQVCYRTHDDMALDGKVYERTAGLLVFESGELIKDVYVGLIDDSNWSPSREFQVELLQEGLVNAQLEKYLWHTRVFVVDDDPFPTGKYKNFVQEDKVDEVPNLGLVIEYMKMQWGNERIRRATKKIIAADMVDHLDFMFKALLQMYLVDFVLNVDLSEEHLFLLPHRFSNLACVAVVSFMPRFILHYLDLKTPFGVGSESRKLLMKSLFGRYLNFNPAVEISEGDFLMAMSRDSLDVVAHIYRGVLHVMQLMGKVVIILGTQFVAPLAFHQPIRWITIIPLCLFPIAMLVFLAVRDNSTTRVLFQRLKQHDALVEFVAEAVQNHNFINECNARTRFLDHCEDKINAYHMARKAAKKVVVNNRQFAKWLSSLVLAFYILTGGVAVINGNLRLGVYVTNLKMFEGMGKIYSDIYLHVLSIQQTTPGLKRLVRLLNLPTDLSMRAEMSQHRQDQADRLFTTLSTHARQDEPLLDQLPISVRDVCFRYEGYNNTSQSVLSKIDGNTDGVSFPGELRLSQGQLVELIGAHGEGKTTLLKLVCGVLFPKLSGIVLDSYSPYFFVPPHLTGLYVPSDPVFFKGGLYSNLTLCVRQGSLDDSSERVAKIVSGLGLRGNVASALEDETDASWLHSLSHAERALLSLARALIANPQLLCLERHWMGFDGKVSKHVLQILREHVDRRGLEQANEFGRIRRPRTCIMTGVDMSNMEFLDKIFNVSHEKGIELVYRR